MSYEAIKIVTPLTGKRKLSQVAKSSDPQNKNWVNDKQAFGFKMLSKMGWSEGKGLGSKEQGEVGFIKVKPIIEKNGIGTSE